MKKEETDCEHEFFPVAYVNGHVHGVEQVSEEKECFVIVECSTCGKLGWMHAKAFEDEA